MNHVTQPQRTASVTAGVALAVMAILAAFGVFGAVDPLVTPGDAGKTALNISDSEALFRWGIVSLILVAVLDIVALIFWLLIKGSRKNFSQEGTHESRHLEPDFLGTHRSMTPRKNVSSHRLPRAALSPHPS